MDCPDILPAWSVARSAGYGAEVSVQYVPLPESDVGSGMMKNPRGAAAVR